MRRKWRGGAGPVFPPAFQLTPHAQNARHDAESALDPTGNEPLTPSSRALTRNAVCSPHVRVAPSAGAP